MVKKINFRDLRNLVDANVKSVAANSRVSLAMNARVDQQSMPRCFNLFKILLIYSSPP